MTAPAQVYGLSTPVDATEGQVCVGSELRLKHAMNTYYAFIWRVLRRNGLSPWDADEAAQDVFLVLSRRLADVLPEAERGFLVGTAIRVASERRRARPKITEVELGEQVEAYQTEVDDLVSLRRARSLLDEALASLSDEQRPVFVLIEMEQLTAPEVATDLRIPLGTVASRLRVARLTFDEAVQRIHRREQGRTNIRSL